MDTVSEQKDTHDLKQLKGVGAKLLEKLNKLGLYSIQDLLFHLPRKYQDRTRIVPIKDLKPGQEALLEGNLSITHPAFVRNRKSMVAKLSDGTGSVLVRFFHFNKQQMDALKQSPRVRCYGELRVGYHGLEMVHPEYQVIKSPMSVDEYLTPVYPTLKGLSQGFFRKTIHQLLNSQNIEQYLRELLPSDVLAESGFTTLAESIRLCHQPHADMLKDDLTSRDIYAYKRLIFEELLAHQLSVLQSKFNSESIEAYTIKEDSQAIQALTRTLGFELTGAQQRVWQDIQADLYSSKSMNRLLQGDVGSGKTIIALFAAYAVVLSGYQVAVMAPTELLAEQHYQEFSRVLKAFDLNITLLTNKTQSKEAREHINSDKAQIVIGTHALFQEQIQFKSLALVIVDEQHRFGVKQRLELRRKGMAEGKMPNQLIMTATPIPRSLTMVAYADLDYSVIDELPKGRKPIKTIVLPDTKRNEVIERIRSACATDSRQVYWVCTLIEESETLDCKAAEDTLVELQQALPELKIALIHSRIADDQKHKIMKAFEQGQLDLLIATTVIEVGINVPNASLMVIENPERLGLAQLHQLRGRVGRGEIASFCILMYHHPLSAQAKERLSALRDSQDGFVIAQRDLELRGPGEVLGTRQTGTTSFRIANIVRDQKLLPDVQKAAQTMLSQHPHFVQPLIKRWLGAESSSYAQV